jgi:hypothetical protein
LSCLRCANICCISAILSAVLLSWLAGEPEVEAASAAGVSDMVLLVKAAGVSEAGGAVSLDGTWIASGLAVSAGFVVASSAAGLSDVSAAG